jgi:predicted dehydrogenase
MGRIHFLASQRLKGAKVAAICSRDPAKRAGDWRNTRGNFGPEPGQVDLSGVKTYEKLEEMLADPQIDLIDVCTVTDQHTPIALAALKAGKHVLVEKAIALSPQEADAMVAAAKSAGKLLMVAHVLPFFPEFKSPPRQSAAGNTGRCWRRTSSASSRSRTGRRTSVTRPRPAARRSISTSTTRTSSAWSAACRSMCSRSAPSSATR